MKFRFKLNSQTYSIPFDDISDEITIVELKTKLKKQFLSLKKSNFHLSIDGINTLDDEKKMSEYNLFTKDVIHILNETNNQSISLISLDQPLTLDEVRDLHTYPLLMHRLVEYSHPQDDFDYIVLAIHALMLESGFQMDAENDYDLSVARKSSTFYVIRYRHKLCEEERIRCSLAIMKTDSLVTIDGVVNPISQACGKLSFNISNYLYTQKEANLNALFPYHDLRNLSRSFKDNLANRLLCKLLEESGQRSSATLIGLPNEIKLRLAKYLPIKSLLALQSTCRDIHNTLNDNLLWHDICIRDFEKAALVSIPNTPESSTNDKNWYKLYRIMYAQKQATLRHQMKSSPFFHPTLFPLVPPGHPTHRLLFSDTSATFHPFPPAIYRPIPPGIIRFCTANTQQAQSPQQQPAQHHIYCQPLFGLKWVVIFAAATMIPLPSCFHPVWLG